MVVVYFDAVLCSGRIPGEVRTNLMKVLNRLQTAGMRLRVEKFSFLENSCVYLGHRLDTGGIHPSTDKFIVLQNAPEPTSVPELRSYLGMVYCCHKFLKNFSSVLAPLHKSLQKDTSWHLGSDQANAFGGVEYVVPIFSRFGALQFKMTFGA